MPTRKIRASPVKVTGSTPDGKQFESFLEEDFFVLLRFNRNVESWEANPITLPWLDASGKQRSYTPDVLVHYRPDGTDRNPISILCEIKPDFDGETDLPRNKLPRRDDPIEDEIKWAAATKYAARRGWRFRVYRESEIRTPHLKNAKFLLRYLERNNAYRGEAALLALLKTHKRMTLAEWVSPFAASAGQRAEHLPTCYRLIAEGQVRVDLSTVISFESIVELVDE